MGLYRLEDRGSDLFDFEGELIANEHTGFLRKIRKNEYILMTNPLLRTSFSECKYIVPSDIEPRIDPNRAVRLSVGPLLGDYDGMYGSSNVVRMKNECRMIYGIEDFNLQIPKSHLSVEDFQQLLINNWTNPEYSYLDLAIPMLAISCPKVNEIGGLGGQTFCVEDGVDTEVLRKGLLGSMLIGTPFELRRSNPLVHFHLVGTEHQKAGLMRCLERKASYEIPYNITSQTSTLEFQDTSLPPSLPLLIKDSSPRGNDVSFQRDLAEFTLKAHMRFVVQDDDMDQYVKNLRKEIYKDYRRDLMDVEVIIGEIEIKRMFLSLERMCQTSSNMAENDVRKQKDKLTDMIRCICESTDEIRRKRTEENKYIPDRFIDLDDCSKDVLFTIRENFTRDSPQVHYDIIVKELEDHYSSRRIKTSIRRLYEGGFIYKPCLDERYRISWVSYSYPRFES